MNEIQAELKLNHVTVYQENAMFKMQGTVKCKAGDNKISVKYLTRKMDKDSIRVRGTGPGKILNININKKFAEVDNRDKIKNLIAQSEGLKEEKKIWKDNLASNKIRIEKSIIAQETFSNEYPKWYSLGKITLSSIEEMDAHFSKNHQTFAEKGRELTKKIVDHDQKIELLQREIDELQYSGRNELNAYFLVEVILTSEIDSEFDLELDYLVGGAYWEPHYDILIKDSLVEINLKANLYNETEVDWEEVTLDISTASTSPVKMIKPDPYNIDHSSYDSRIQFRKQGKKSKMRSNSPMPMKKMDFVAQTNVMEEQQTFYEPEPSIEPLIGSLEADVTSNLGVQVYSLNTMFTIESNREPKPIQLLKEELPSILQYFWTCTSPNRVLVNNKIKNADHLILPGDAKIYVDGEFIGSTELDLIAPQQTFKLGERISYDIRVKKEMKAKKKEKEGAFRGKNATTYQYIIEIENLKTVSEELIMYERVPHSVSEKIKVKLLNISENPATNVMNVMKFVLKMDKIPKKKVISYSYEVISEKDIYIQPPLP